MLYVLVDPKKEDKCQEGLLMVKWAQTHNHSLAVLAEGGLAHTPNFRGSATKPPALCSGWLS